MIDQRTAPPSATNVCALVVAYYPDDGFEARLVPILPQVAMLLIVDNTPDALPLSQHFQEKWDGTLFTIKNNGNKGIAKALNQGLSFASERGFPWLLTLDQDTNIYSDIVRTLSNTYVECEPAPAVIGANYIDRQNKRIKVKPQNRMGYVVQKTVITSGSLIDVTVAMHISGFSEDYFIDQVDHEFCLRVRANGGRVVISRKPTMEHSVGETGGAWLPLLGHLPSHPPLRKYYIARNSLVTITRYWRSEPTWCLRRALRLLLGLPLMAVLERQRVSKVRAFCAGIADGWCGRMGPCGREWLTESTG